MNLGHVERSIELPTRDTLWVTRDAVCRVVSLGGALVTVAKTVSKNKNHIYSSSANFSEWVPQGDLMNLFPPFSIRLG